VRGDTNSRAATVLVAQALADEFDDVELGAGQRCPTGAGAPALAAAALRGRDRLVSRGPAPWKPVADLSGPITLLIEFETRRAFMKG